MMSVAVFQFVLLHKLPLLPLSLVSLLPHSCYEHKSVTSVWLLVCGWENRSSGEKNYKYHPKREGFWVISENCPFFHANISLSVRDSDDLAQLMRSDHPFTLAAIPFPHIKFRTAAWDFTHSSRCHFPETIPKQWDKCQKHEKQRIKVKM